jgi:hydrogenase maturation protease
VAPGSALIIGYGHSLRGDDGVGQVVAQALWSPGDRRGLHDDADVVWAQQLVPEMALDLSLSTVALFVDAACDGRPPGTVTVRGVNLGGAADPPQRTGTISIGCWEDLAPARLLALCADLYGHAPPAFLITISVDAPRFGPGLSPAVEAAVPTAVAATRYVITAFYSPCTNDGRTAPLAPRRGTAHA